MPFNGRLDLQIRRKPRRIDLNIDLNNTDSIVIACAMGGL
jgi:hypothetical protein